MLAGATCASTAMSMSDGICAWQPADKPSNQSNGDLSSMPDMWKVFEENTITWIKEESIDTAIADVGSKLFSSQQHVVGENISSAVISHEEVHEWGQRAKAILDEMLSVGDFNDDDLDMRLVQDDIFGVAEIGLFSYIEKRANVHRFKGLREEELRGSAAGFVHRDLLMDLKRSGQRSFVTSKFQPNAGKNYQPSKIVS
jgi:hypothetical protein